MATVYIEKEKCDHVRIKNDTGAELAQYEFAVVGPFAAVADEVIASGAVGSFHVEEGIQVQSSNLTDTEDTFATIGQKVYFDTATGKFSDTLTVDYYLVGHLLTVKDSDGVILFEKERYAVVVTASLVALITAVTELSGKPFRKVATLTSVAAATPVDILTAAEVGAGKTAYITSFLAKVNGVVAWEGDGTIVTIQDDSDVVGITLAKAQLTSQALLDLLETGVTLGTAVSLGTGFTAANGLVILADGAFATGGSDIVVTLTGYIA